MVLNKIVFKKNNIVIFIAVLLIFLCTYNVLFLDKFPSYIHAHAQSDRYALALGFIDNNFDFFHPQTYVMNHQFPGDYKIPSEHSITAVDFPIHEYAVALLMKLCGSRSFLIFNIYVYIYSLIGLAFIYKISFLLSKSLSKSFFILLFAASSPILIYYQSGSLPSIPSLANAFIGIFFYFKYLKSNEIRPFWGAIFFMTLAALSRTPFSILIIAVLFNNIFKSYSLKKINWTTYIILGISGSVILAYFVYNTILRENYGSMFLSQIMYPESWGEVLTLLSLIKDRWAFHYFTEMHYLYFAILFLLFLYSYIKKGWQSIVQFSSESIYITIVFIGCLSYSFLMLRQFPAHDYYFLDTFFLPIIVSLCLIISAIPNIKLSSTASIIFIILFSSPLFILARGKQIDRRDSGNWDRISSTSYNFQGSEELLDDLNIELNSKILVLDAYAPNIPFILLNRKGYSIINTKRENIIDALTWKYDYIVFQNEFFITEVYLNYSEIINLVENLSSNNKITVAKIREYEKQTTLHEFFGLNDMIPVFYESYNFDTLEFSNQWSKTRRSDMHKVSGNYSGFVDATKDFGITYKIKNLSCIKEKSRLVFLKCNVFTEYSEHDKTHFVVSVKNSESTAYLRFFDIYPFIKNNSEWTEVNLIYQIPKIYLDEFEFDVFIWNEGKNDLYYDDLEISMY